jgi:hypothetical protein
VLFSLVVRGTVNPCLNIHFFADLPHQTNPARCVRVAIALTRSFVKGSTLESFSHFTLAMCPPRATDLEDLICANSPSISCYTLQSAVTRFECHKHFQSYQPIQSRSPGLGANPRPR